MTRIGYGKNKQKWYVYKTRWYLRYILEEKLLTKLQFVSDIISKLGIQKGNSLPRDLHDTLPSRIAWTLGTIEFAISDKFSIGDNWTDGWLDYYKNLTYKPKYLEEVVSNA
jgi:hypothetical protein